MSHCVPDSRETAEQDTQSRAQGASAEQDPQSRTHGASAEQDTQSPWSLFLKTFVIRIVGSPRLSRDLV